MIAYDEKQLKTVQQEYKLDFAALFGSFAKGEEKKTSDIDIAIKRNKPLSLKELTELTDKFSKIFAIPFEKIGLVEIQHPSPILMWQIAKYGRFMTGNFSKFEKFRLYSLRKYFDTKKFRKQTKDYIKRNIHAG